MRSTCSGVTTKASRSAPRPPARIGSQAWRPGQGGAPLLSDALASLECEIVAEHAAGDHWIVVGQVDHLRTMPNAAPLLFFAGQFGTLQEPR